MVAIHGRPDRRRALIGMMSVAWLFGAVATAPASAQAADRYPERPITLIVPFAPGGASDVIGRLVGQKLSSSLGKMIVVENRAGANGNLGAAAAAKSDPDGYTLVLVADGTVAINPNFGPKPQFDPEKDLMPISRVALLSLVLVANPSIKANTLPELVELSKQSSSDLNFSSAGPGSTGHLAGELLKARTGLRMTHISYRGGGQAVNDALSGQVPLFMTSLATVNPFVASKQLKPIGVSSAKRIGSIPDVATFAESGAKDFDVASWYGIMAPAGTPQAIVDRLQREIVSALQDPKIRDHMQTLGAEPIGDTPAEFAKALHEDLARWKRVIKDADLNAQ